MMSKCSYQKLKECPGNIVTDFFDKLSKDSLPFVTTIDTIYELKCLVVFQSCLAIGLKNGMVITYDLSKNLEVARFMTGQSSVDCLGIDPERLTITVAGKSKEFESWKADGSFQEKAMTGHENSIVALKYCFNNLYMCDRDGFLSMQKPALKIIKAHSVKITALDSLHILATSSHDCLIRFWNESLDPLFTLTSIKSVHRICFINKDRLASASIRSLFCIWNLSTKTIERMIDNEEAWVNSITHSPNDEFLIAGTFDFSVRYINTFSADDNIEENFQPHKAAVNCVAFNSTGSILITGSKDKTVKLWNCSYEFKGQSILHGHQEEVLSLCVTEDEEFMYSGDLEGKIIKWDLDSYAISCQLNAHGSGVSAIIEVGKDIISISEDKYLKVWRADKFHADCDLKEYLISICASETQIFVGARSGNIHVLDLSYKLTSSFNAHWSSVSSLVINRGFLISAGHDRNVNIWYLTTLALKFSHKAHQSPIKRIVINPNGETFLTASYDKTIKVWYPGTPPYGCTLNAHDSSVTTICFIHNGEYFYTGDKKGNAIIWCEKEMADITRIKLPEAIKDIKELKRKKMIATASGNKIYICTQFITEKNVITWPNNHMFLFFQHISNIVAGKMVPFKSYFKDYVILPYRVNILHAMAYVNDYEGIKIALRSNVKFYSSHGFNPLRIALNRGSYQCVDAIIKAIPDLYSKHSVQIFKLIENEITEILRIHLNNLPLMLASGFSVVKSKALPTFADLTDKKLVVSERISITPGSFNLKEGALHAIEFHVSAFRLPLILGSEDCMKLLHSILKCEDPEVFDQLIIQSILDYLFKQASPILIIVASINFISILFLLFYTSSFRDNILVTILILLINFFSLLIELGQMHSNFLYYISDIWNLVDTLRITFLFIAIFLLIDEREPDLAQDVMSCAILFSMIRMISLFRLFEDTRYMIRMVFQVIADLKSFLLILLMTTTTIAVSFYFKDFGTGSFLGFFTRAFLMNFGQFDVNDFDLENWYSWTLFLFALFLNPLVMMNLLIATMGDTYSRIQSNIVISNYKETTSLILETCTFMLWKRQDNRKVFLQRCGAKSQVGSTGSIETKIKKLKVVMDEVHKISYENNRKINEIIEKVKK